MDYDLGLHVKEHTHARARTHTHTHTNTHSLTRPSSGDLNFRCDNALKFKRLFLSPSRREVQLTKDELAQVNMNNYITNNQNHGSGYGATDTDLG